jgi:major membrane immunogen (membrane-anchored lipoprotein)
MTINYGENMMAFQGLVCSLSLAALLCACNMVDAMKDGMAQSNAVADDLDKSLGSKPHVGFNWMNGTLASVTVEFKGEPKGKTLDEISEAARVAVKKEFSQAPQRLVLAFDLDAG